MDGQTDVQTDRQTEKRRIDKQTFRYIDMSGEADRDTQTFSYLVRNTDIIS
jgi:hypothetical protein